MVTARAATAAGRPRASRIALRLAPALASWALAYAMAVVAGGLLLLLPAASTGGASAGDAFFTAVSAVTLTGLTPVPTGEHWTLLGEGAIAACMAAGGLLWLLGAGLALWLLGRRLGVRDAGLRRAFRGRLSAREALAAARPILAVALAAQALGAIALFPAMLGADLPAGRALWWAAFHAVAAFANAGFALPPEGYAAFADDPAVLAITGALAFAGGLGPLPVALWLARRSFRRLPFDARVATAAMLGALAAGAGALLAAEWSNAATLGGEAVWMRPFLALYESSMRTTGLTALETVALRDESKVLLTGLMAIGGAAGSVSGGLKVGAAAVLAAGVAATLRGRGRLSLPGRELPAGAFRMAFTLALLFGATAAGLGAGLVAASGGSALDALVEGVAALSLTGWSTGLTAGAGAAERALLLAGMIAGRFGPLLLVLFMARDRRAPSRRHPEDSIRFG